jgi:outer membrane protein assembly factor BamC
MKILRIGISGIALASLIGCGSAGLGNNRIDYRSAAVQAPSLEVPPDLTAPQADDRYRVPEGEGVATFSDYSKGGTAADPGRRAGQVLPEVPGAHLERNGAQRWLVVNDQPENVWGVVKLFLQENGLNIENEDQAAGVIETGWVENRANIPQDGLRKLIGKVFDSVYSSGERDRYRVRLERGKGGGTEIYITHRGLEEVISGDGNTSKWQARPSDPELEAIMLQRLLARFGGDAETPGASGEAAEADTPGSDGKAHLVSIFDGSRIIVVNDAFDRSWRRVGLAIERAGLAVEDRDRNKGIYLLRPASKEKGWLDKLKFWESDDDADRRYRVNVRDGGAVCEVSVTGLEGAHDEAAGQVLEAIYKHINE